MDCDTQGPQVIDPQHAADYIPPKIIENENFPYGFPIRVEEKCRLLLSFSIWRRRVCMIFGALVSIVIQIEDLLDRGYTVKLAEGLFYFEPYTAYQPVDRAVTVVAGPSWMEKDKSEASSLSHRLSIF